MVNNRLRPFNRLRARLATLRAPRLSPTPTTISPARGKGLLGRLTPPPTPAPTSSPANASSWAARAGRYSAARDAPVGGLARSSLRAPASCRRVWQRRMGRALFPGFEAATLGQGAQHFAEHLASGRLHARLGIPCPFFHLLIRRGKTPRALGDTDRPLRPGVERQEDSTRAWGYPWLWPSGDEPLGRLHARLGIPLCRSERGSQLWKTPRALGDTQSWADGLL